ncbi:hypothetical protein RSOLAG1IB_10021 [Rhizoctonia solani AG-1 IB]|uniref:Uncharacterized protein n=1 Tax=Thanatephorus cucumeris (strain AG1-IB / isolate 7/3/14) TaxID=1108050 RepID=A0A0B7FX25_THACB|nr:hypothetical protein RSOLAG1IB_10021 [Rhizoctonia solani AG-1 IB]
MMSSYECHRHSSQFYWKQVLIAAAFLIKILKSKKVLLPHIISSITEENHELLGGQINNYITMLTHDSSANGLDLTRHGIMLRDMWEVGDSNTLAPELGTPTPVDHSISLFWESPAGLGAPDQPGTSDDSPAV